MTCIVRLPTNDHIPKKPTTCLRAKKETDKARPTTVVSAYASTRYRVTIPHVHGGNKPTVATRQRWQHPYGGPVPRFVRRRLGEADDGGPPVWALRRPRTDLATIVLYSFSPDSTLRTIERMERIRSIISCPFGKGEK